MVMVDSSKPFVAGMLYIVRVHEDGEIMEYEYGNINHATQHYDWENMGNRVELLSYSTITGTEETIMSK